MGGATAARRSFGGSEKTFGKPSHAWREGWLLGSEGWPAQEGGTDSHAHRTSHDVRQPAELLDGGESGASCSRMGAAASRYPSWWPVVAEPAPAPPARTPVPAALPRWDVENLAVLNGVLQIPMAKETVDRAAGRAPKTPGPRGAAKPPAAPVPISWRFSEPELAAGAVPRDPEAMSQHMQQMQQMQHVMLQQMQLIQQLQQAGAGMMGIPGAMGPGGIAAATAATYAQGTQGEKHGAQQPAPVKQTQAQKSRALSARGNHPCRAQAQAQAHAQAHAQAEAKALARARVLDGCRLNRQYPASPHSQAMPCMRGAVKSASSLSAIDSSYRQHLDQSYHLNQSYRLPTHAQAELARAHAHTHAPRPAARSVRSCDVAEMRRQEKALRAQLDVARRRQRVSVSFVAGPGAPPYGAAAAAAVAEASMASSAS